MGSMTNIIGLITLIVTVASIVAAITPTPKDDQWIGKLYKFIDLLAFNIGKAKDKAKAIDK
tara:strand:- start:527 stop:709 length:183 start_codon:yes stop_codon:yes gene_type:complete